MDTPNTLAERVRQARLRRRYTQAQLAKLARIGQPSLSSIESGSTSTLRGPSLLRLAEALEVDPHWLLSGTEGSMESRPTYHEEEEIVKLYRRMPSETRSLWKAIGDVLIEHSSRRPKR